MSNSHSKIKGLGVYQIAGGILGLGLTVLAIPEKPSLTEILFLATTLGLYSYSVYCGIVLFTQKEKALKYSAINQYLQLINFAVLGYGFEYISGGYLSVGIDLTNAMIFRFNMGFSNYQLNINTDNQEGLINLNLLALFLLLFINRLKMKSREQEFELDLANKSNSKT